MANMYFKYGVMNCGKTTALLQVAHNYEENGMNVLVIKSEVDKKGTNNIVSRLGMERKVDIIIPYDKTIFSNTDLSNIDCILVDEAQFMSKMQIKELWIISKLLDIPVICYGLKTNFKGELFEGSKAIIELADKLEELSTICKCGNKAKFNARIENDKYIITGEEIAIDGIEASYEPLCGECYIKKVLKKEYYY